MTASNIVAPALRKLAFTVSAEDIMWARLVATERIRPKRGKGTDRLGVDEPKSHVIGALGELAFCRFLGIPWLATVDAYSDVADVPPGVEVKASLPRTRAPYRMKVSLKDAKDARMASRLFVYMAVDIESGECKVMGCLPGSVVRDNRSRWTRTPKAYPEPAVFVEMNDMGTMTTDLQDRIATKAQEWADERFDLPPAPYATFYRDGVGTVKRVP